MKDGVALHGAFVPKWACTSIERPSNHRDTAGYVTTPYLQNSHSEDRGLPCPQDTTANDICRSKRVRPRNHTVVGLCP